LSNEEIGESFEVFVTVGIQEVGSGGSDLGDGLTVVGESGEEELDCLGVKSVRGEERGEFS